MPVAPGAVAALGLATPAASAVVGLSENDVGALHVELAGFGSGDSAGFCVGNWRHGSIFVDAGGLSGVRG